MGLYSLPGPKLSSSLNVYPSAVIQHGMIGVGQGGLQLSARYKIKAMSVLQASRKIPASDAKL